MTLTVTSTCLFFTAHPERHHRLNANEVGEGSFTVHLYQYDFHIKPCKSKSISMTKTNNKH